MRIVVVTALCLAISVNAYAQDLKSKPQYERMLKGEDAKKAKEMQKKLDDFMDADRFAEAKKVAEELLALRVKLQGEDHWEVIDVRQELKSIAIYTKLKPEELNDLKNAESATQKLMSFVDQGIYPTALGEAIVKIQLQYLSSDHPVVAASLNNLAMLYQAQGLYEKAVLYAEQSLKIAENALGADHPNVSNSLNSLALFYTTFGNYDKAKPLLERALAINEKAHGMDHPTVAFSLMSLAGLFDHQRQHPKSEPLYQRALAIFEKVYGKDHINAAYAMNNLACLLEIQGQYAKAEILFQRSLAIREKAYGKDHPVVARSLNQLASQYQELGQYAKAESLCERSLVIREKAHGKDHPYVAISLNNLATLYRAQGQYAKAEPLYERSLAINEKVYGNEHPQLAESLVSMAQLYQDMGDYAKATPYWRRAAFANEAGRLIGANGIDRAQLKADSVNPLLPLAIFEHQKNPRSAWGHLEQTLARGLLDQRTNGQALLAKEELTVLNNALEQIREMQPRIFQLVTSKKFDDKDYKQLEKLMQQRQELTKVISEIAVAENNRLVAKTEEIQSAIPADAALLVWIDVGKQRYACIVRAKGDPIWVQLPGSGEKELWTKLEYQLTNDLRAELGKDRPDFTKITDLFAKVKTQRFTPLIKHLEGIRTLYVVPVGDMAGIPIEALTDKFTISYVPSGTFLARRSKPSDKAANILAFGNPIFDHPHKPKEWKELPGTQVELGQLQRLFGDRATIHTKSDASEQTLETIRKSGKLKDYRYLHFATHGEGNNVHAFESKLILAQDKLPKELMPKSGEPFLDGCVSAREVLEYWKLDAELVTLSACETALGKSAGGDGLLGFAQAFLTAGSRSVCLSLWKVSDSATTLLMDRFYANLLGKRDGLTKPMTKIEALHEAKQWLRNLTEKDVEVWTERLPSEEMKKQFREAHRSRAKGVDLSIVEPKGEKPYAHPKYWSGFILIGDPN